MELNPVQKTDEFSVERNLLTLSGGDFTVTDSNGNIVFKSSGKVLSFHRQRVLHDGAGNAFIMKKKILTMHKRWKVFNDGAFNGQKLAFSVKKSSVFQLKTALDVFMADSKDQNLCDFHVKSSFFNRSCKIYQGDQVVAEMKKKCTLVNILLKRGLYSVVVQPGVDHAFIVALIIILDYIHCS